MTSRARKLRRQCRHCPWKLSTNPADIPNGYDPTAHAALSNTIATPGVFGELRVMACHESNVGRELPCVGWMHHQLGEGDNIALRYAAAMHLVDTNVEIDGPQHVCFADTLGTTPKR